MSNNSLEWGGPYTDPMGEKVLIDAGLYKARVESYENKVNDRDSSEFALISWRILKTDSVIFQRLYYYGKTDKAHEMAKVNLNKIKKALNMPDATKGTEFIGGVAAINVTNDGQYNNVADIYDIKNFPELDAAKAVAPKENKLDNDSDIGW